MSNKVTKEREKKREEKFRFAQVLRGRPTGSEIRMRKLLRTFEWRFCFQFPLFGYIVDFIFVDRKLVIEVDGGYHNTDRQRRYDRIRDGALSKRGYTTLRIKNEQVDNIEQVRPIIEQEFWKAEKCFNLNLFKNSRIKIENQDGATTTLYKITRHKKKRRKSKRRGREAL